jgi:hypothetical protein
VREGARRKLRIGKDHGVIDNMRWKAKRAMTWSLNRKNYLGASCMPISVSSAVISRGNCVVEEEIAPLH